MNWKMNSALRKKTLYLKLVNHMFVREGHTPCRDWKWNSLSKTHIGVRKGTEARNSRKCHCDPFQLFPQRMWNFTVKSQPTIFTLSMSWFFLKILHLNEIIQYSWSFLSTDSTFADASYQRSKIFEKNSIMFPKSKPKSAMSRQHLHSIYIGVGKISNLEMV